jgi:hypothetical protein
MKKHKHHDLIVLWAQGAIIQYYAVSEWVNCNNNRPLWKEDGIYRVKPEPKPDLLRYVHLAGPEIYRDTKSVHDHICLVFDGETQELKEVKMLKD